MSLSRIEFTEQAAGRALLRMRSAGDATATNVSKPYAESEAQRAVEYLERAATARTNRFRPEHDAPELAMEAVVVWVILAMRGNPSPMTDQGFRAVARDWKAEAAKAFHRDDVADNDVDRDYTDGELESRSKPLGRGYGYGRY